jgi:hypothetical protein
MHIENMDKQIFYLEVTSNQLENPKELRYMILSSCITRLSASLLERVPQFLLDSVNKLWRILCNQLEIGTVEVKEASLICLRTMLNNFEPPVFAADELLFSLFSLLSLDASVNDDRARSNFRLVFGTFLNVI